MTAISVISFTIIVSIICALSIENLEIYLDRKKRIKNNKTKQTI